MNTTILAPRQSSLQTGISTGMGTPNPPRMILKPAPGRPGTSARFEMLPEGKSRFGSIGASVAIQAALLAVILIIPLVFPERMIPKVIFQVIPLATPVTEVPLPPPPAPKVAAVKPKPVPVLPEPVKETPVVEPVRQPKVLAPHVVLPKMEVKPVAPAVAPKIEAKFDAPEVKLDTKMNEPARPRAPVQTGLIGTGSSAAATLPSNTPLNKVQTGGFGDPNGVAGPSDPNKRANVNARGDGNLPPGPGYGNGTGGANGARGTVASTGFGNGIANPPPGGNGRGGQRSVQSGGFGAAVVEAEKPKQQGTQTAAVQPIEITDKPRPDYTPEARALKIEGQVVVSVIFKANGEIIVQNVVQGLGHGLDEMAVKAAKQIKYKPAISNGQPVDFPARVRIEFQLAY